MEVEEAMNKKQNNLTIIKLEQKNQNTHIKNADSNKNHKTS